MNQKIICKTCGTQYNTDIALDICPICADDRQYIPEEGQGWTNLDVLSETYGVTTKKITEQLYEIQMVPNFAIGQRALLVCTPGGNILWDCIALLNEPLQEFIKSKGGLSAIAFLILIIIQP